MPLALLGDGNYFVHCFGIRLWVRPRRSPPGGYSARVKSLDPQPRTLEHQESYTRA
jgi:hypothetical protein